MEWMPANRKEAATSMKNVLYIVHFILYICILNLKMTKTYVYQSLQL